MSKTLKKTLGALGGLAIIALILWISPKLDKPFAQKCYWVYKDMFGEVGEANQCQNEFGNVYCGTNDKLVLVSEAERICIIEE